MSDPQTQPTVFAEKENAALSIFSAEYFGRAQRVGVGEQIP
jgi:hypothetical protein